MTTSAEQWQDREANFIANMKTLRESAEISQGELAKILKNNGWAGIYQTTISRIEKGERPVRLAEAEAIADAFNTGLNKMLEPPTQQRLVQEMRGALARYLRMTREVEHLAAMIERTRAEVLTIIRDASLYADEHPGTPQADALNNLIAEATRAIGGNHDGERQAEA